MSYVVLEIQTMPDGHVAVIATQHATEAEAAAKYHTILAAAALSQLPAHAATILTNEAYQNAQECYHHESVA